MGINAFTPLGNTVVFTAATTTPSPVQAAGATLGPNQYRIINTGAVTVFLGVSISSAGATANAVIVTSTGGAIPLLAGTDEILSFLPNAYFTGITASGTGAVYITPGDGI